MLLRRRMTGPIRRPTLRSTPRDRGCNPSFTGRVRRRSELGLTPKGTGRVELCESEERRDLRAAVAAIARSYGQEYYLSKSLAGEKSTELWQEIGKQGFLGVNIAEKYGGGGVARERQVWNSPRSARVRAWRIRWRTQRFRWRSWRG